MRDDDGWLDPVLGRLAWDGNAHVWRGRLGVGDGDCDLTLIEADDAGFPDCDPRPSGLARLRGAAARLDEVLMPCAIGAVTSARIARLSWRHGPPERDWSAVELLVAADDSLWLSLHEYETDEYSLWIVRFDSTDAAMEVRRASYGPDPAPICRRGAVV